MGIYLFNFQGHSHIVQPFLDGGIGDCRRVAVVLEDNGLGTGQVHAANLYALAAHQTGNVEGIGLQAVQLRVVPHGGHLAQALGHLFHGDAVVKMHALGFHRAGVGRGEAGYLNAVEASFIYVIQAVQLKGIAAVVEFPSAVLQLYANVADRDAQFLQGSLHGISAAFQADFSLLHPQFGKGDGLEEGGLPGRCFFDCLLLFLLLGLGLLGQGHFRLRLPDDEAFCPSFPLEKAAPPYALQLDGVYAGLDVRAFARGVC